jgi:hypothetical protein
MPTVVCQLKENTESLPNEILQLQASLSVSFTPLGDELETYFYTFIEDDLVAKEACRLLLKSNEVLAAYVKPADSPPG